MNIDWFRLEYILNFIIGVGVGFIIWKIYTLIRQMWRERKSQK